MLLLVLVSAHADPFGFSPGTSPVELSTQAGVSDWTPARDCAGCHSDVYEQWSVSRHRVSWTNNLMQAGFIAEPQMFCVNCHAPAAEQVEEIRPNLATYEALGPHAPPHTEVGILQPEPKAEEGINCAVCHLRDGEILTSTPGDPDAPHRFRVEPSFSTSAACTTCHEFFSPVFVNGLTHFTDEPMQATATEWERWKAQTGRTEGCPSCHMPDGAHQMHGAHDLQRVSDSIQVRVTAQALTLSTRDVGHAVPTGDLFRHLTLEARPSPDEPWSVVDTLGRTFTVDDTLDPPLKRQVGDTRLHPGAPRVVEIPERFGGGQWQLRYHYGGPHDEARGIVSPDQLIRVVHTGTLAPTAPVPD